MKKKYIQIHKHENWSRVLSHMHNSIIAGRNLEHKKKNNQTGAVNFFYDMALTQSQLQDNLQQAQTIKHKITYLEPPI